MPITKIVTDNDGVNINSETLAMRIMDDEGRKLIAQFNEYLLEKLPEDHIYKTFPGKSTDKIVRALIEGDWDKTDTPNPELSLPLDSIALSYGLASDATIEDVSTHIADLITIATIERFSQELNAISGTTEAWEELAEKLGAENLALATTSRADRMDVSLNHAINPDTGENARLHEFFPEGSHRFSGYGGPNKYDAFFEQMSAIKGLPPRPQPNLPEEYLNGGFFLDLSDPDDFKRFENDIAKRSLPVDPAQAEIIAKYKTALEDPVFLEALAKYEDAYKDAAAIAEENAWDPAECAIVEDSDSGVAYAKAGRPDTKVIGTVAADFFVDKGAQASKLMSKGADIVISTMHDLPKAVEWLNNGLTPETKPDFTGKIYTPVVTAQPEAAPATPSMG